LIEDLAESMLIALASRVNGSIDTNSSDSDDLWMWNMNIWTDGEIHSMKQSIITLMGAAGQTVLDANNLTIPELLQAFVVGTEGRKKWKEKSKIPPKPSELGPIADMHFMSTANRAKHLPYIQRVVLLPLPHLQQKILNLVRINVRCQTVQ